MLPVIAVLSKATTETCSTLSTVL